MEPLLYHLYSGQLFFSSAAILLAVAILALCGALESRPLLRSIASVLALASIPAAALSGTPMPALQALVVTVACLAFTLFGIVAPPQRRTILATLAIVAACGAITAELRWHLPVAPVRKPRRLIVIGDSLSSGGFGESATWPQLVASGLGAEVQNLALPGETASAAVTNQLPELAPSRPGDCVVVAIGGNDMLDRLPAGGFEESLDRILEAASAGSTRDVVMIELPIVPGEWRFGAVQRRMARQHGATLLPKRILARVLVEPANTFDGLHPTQRGHDELAREIRASLRW